VVLKSESASNAKADDFSPLGSQVMAWNVSGPIAATPHLARRLVHEKPEPAPRIASFAKKSVQAFAAIASLTHREVNMKFARAI
jgi:hypothetical protein